ncbi:MAG: hybrid sensor histidine kinase/response regulator [Ignavibacteria bacterium]|nr:hybrid sensor histidine kinase/response regulator [Ignavibacteria bacterium]
MAKILVIEDDYNIRTNICEILESEGYHTLQAENGQAGLQIIKSRLPDLIICDIMMPELNGFEVLERTKKYSSAASIPFIFLTAKVEPENLRKGMNLGADDYLLKPFHIQDLLDSVKTRLEKKEVVKKELNDLQEQIIAKIPHELRTPLVPILGYAELIEDEENIENIKEMASLIKKFGKSLHSKIEKFLIYQDLLIKEAKEIDLKQRKYFTEITSEMIASYLTGLDPDLNSKERAKIKVESYNLNIAEWYLETLVKELVENGLKYSDHSKPVSIIGTKENAQYRIAVLDQGRGMSKEEINSISAFKKFGEEQLSETGVGLGLAIVMKIVNTFKAEISITSKPNNFTKVELSFPHS